MKGKNKKVESKSKTDSLSICPCEKTLKGRPSWIACDYCKQWWHGSCVSLTTEICALFRNKSLPYLCSICTLSKVNHKQKEQSDKPMLNGQYSDSKQEDTGSQDRIKSQVSSGIDPNKVQVDSGCN